jgi:hypothetical protein
MQTNAKLVLRIVMRIVLLLLAGLSTLTVVLLNNGEIQMGLE